LFKRAFGIGIKLSCMLADAFKYSKKSFRSVEMDFL